MYVFDTGYIFKGSEFLSLLKLRNNNSRIERKARPFFINVDISKNVIKII